MEENTNTEIAVTQTGLERIELSPALVGKEKAIAIARQSRRVNEMTVEETQESCVDLITKAFFQNGQSVVDTDLFLMAQDLSSVLRDYFSGLSIEELKICFREGALGLYGNHFPLCTKTFNAWVTGYLTCDERQQSRRKQIEYHRLLNEPPKKSPQEVEEQVRAGCLDLFEKFRNGTAMLFFDAGNIYYDYLDRLKIFPFTRERKLEFLESAKNRIRSKAQNEMRDARGLTAIQAIKATIEGIDQKGNEMVMGEAKRVALETYFKDLLEMGNELKDELEKIEREHNETPETTNHPV